MCVLSFAWIIIWAVCTLSVCSQYARFVDCPEFIQPQENLINCTVNTTAANSQGCTIGNVLRFELVSDSGGSIIVCSSQLNSCTDTDFNAEGCKCLSHNGDLKNYQLNYTPKAVHNGKDMICSFDCLGSDANISINPRCQNLDLTAYCTEDRNGFLCKDTFDECFPKEKQCDGIQDCSSYDESEFCASEDNNDDDDGDTAAIAGGTVGGAAGIVVLGVGAFLLTKRKQKVYVGFPREQTKRIDYYAKRLVENLRTLSEGLKPFHATVTIVNQRASDGSKSKGGTEHLHILVKRSHRAGLRKWKEILNKTKEFLNEHVRQPFVRTVFVSENTKIPDETSIKIEGVTVIFPTENGRGQNERRGEENAEVRKKEVVRIFHTAKNEEGKYVIQIEGPSQKSVEAVEKKVKDELMKQHTVTRTYPLKSENKLDDVSRQYIEEMTGTTIREEENPTPKQIKIEGFNDLYVQEAETKVKEFLKNNVRMVLVPDGGYPIDLEELKKIGKQTGVNVSGPFENGKDQYVVQVDGQDPGVEEAVSKVKALFGYNG